MNKLLFKFLLLPLLVIATLSDQGVALADDDPLVMGVFPRRNAAITHKIFKPIADHLSATLNRKVILVTAKDFKTFWKSVAKQKYDLVHYNQYHYIKSHKNYGYRVILKNEEFGKSTLTGSITIRKDSGINNILDLKGKRIAFGGGPAAMMSYILPSYLLRKAGLKKGDYTEAFAKNPPNAVMSAYYHQYDAAGAGDVVLKLGMVKNQIDTNEMTYLIKGEQMAHLPWAVKQNMSPELENNIQQSLLDLNNSDKGKNILKSAKLTGIRLAKDNEYNPHREVVNFIYNERY